MNLDARRQRSKLIRNVKINNENFKKVSDTLPKNKTGIFASEIKGMVVPNQKLYYQQTTPNYTNKQLKTISLSNCFLSAMDYRVNSAFRVSVRPRQSYASLNVKLLEQQRPYSKYTSSCSRGMRPNTVSTKYTENLVSDDEYERIGTPSTISNEATGNEYFTFNKDAFRPSPIRKLSKLNANTIDSNSRFFTSKFVNNIEEFKMRKNIKSASEVKSKTISIDNKSLSSMKEVEHRKKTISNRLKSILKNEETNNENMIPTVVKNDLDDGDHMIEHSELGITEHASTKLDSSANLFKMTSDIFNEIYSEVNNSNNNINNTTNQSKSKTHSKSASLMKSSNILALNDANALASFLSNKSKNVHFKTKSNSEIEKNNKQDEQITDNITSSREYLSNLKEEEFIHFLKEYRRTKCLDNLADANRRKTSSANGLTTANSNPQLANIRTQFLNLYVDKNAVSSCTSSTSNIQSNQYESINQQGNKNYFYKYLQQKLFQKQQTKSTTNSNNSVHYLINDTLKKNSNSSNNLYFDASNLLDNKTSNHLTKSGKDKQLKHQLNVLNFPGIENY